MVTDPFACTVQKLMVEFQEPSIRTDPVPQSPPTPVVPVLLGGLLGGALLTRFLPRSSSKVVAAALVTGPAGSADAGVVRVSLDVPRALSGRTGADEQTTPLNAS